MLLRGFVTANQQQNELFTVLHKIDTISFAYIHI